MDVKWAGNRLLAALPAPCAERLLANAQMIELPLGLLLFERGERPRYLYFLTEGITSTVFNSERGASVELSTEGKEGLIGAINLLGPATLDGDGTMQVSGAGYRVPYAAVQRAFQELPDARQRILEYVQHQHVLANQVLACNRLHRAEARFSRWLLMVSDRIGSNDLPMTQEFMSSMLGTRRTTVAEVSSDLARVGAVEGRRGGLKIASRAVLEAHACECYGILRGRFEQLYKAPVQPGGGC